MPKSEGRGRLSADTSLDIEDRIVDRWRDMSPAQKFALVQSACGLANALARAGLRSQYPNAAERELFLRLAVRRLGRDAVVTVYEDAHEYADLDGP